MTPQQLFNNGVRRIKGEDARKLNLLASKLIANLVKNCFGPGGKEKMFIDILGEITLTKNGCTFLRKIDVEHPAAKVLIDASNSIDNEVGDGTTTVVLLAGGLLEKAEELLDMNFSPNTILDGYHRGLEIILKLLNEIGKEANSNDITLLKKIVDTCLITKTNPYFFEDNNDNLTDLIVDAICKIRDSSMNELNIDDIKIEEKLGNITDTKLINGIVIDKTIDSSAMPRNIENAKILLIDDDLEPTRTKTDAQIIGNSYKEIQNFVKAESDIISNKVQKIIESGANVVISRKGINLRACEYFAKARIISIKRVKENDLFWLEKSTGAKIINDVNSLQLENFLGFAGKVYEKLVGDDKMVFLDECKDPKAVTLLIRANSKMILDDLHRTVLSVITVVNNFVKNPRIVGGGGACEAMIASKLRSIAYTINNKEQIVVQKFADVLEEIPLIIAYNLGMNVIDVQTKLRSKINNNNKKYNNIKWYGINGRRRNVEEIFDKIIEPCFVKEQVITTAVEVSSLLLCVDDVLMAKPTMNTHTHDDGTVHSHDGGDRKHDHYFDQLGKKQRPTHHYY
jgi:chaperonin GroEL (HSP60 family)